MLYFPQFIPVGLLISWLPVFNYGMLMTIVVVLIISGQYFLFIWDQGMLTLAGLRGQLTCYTYITQLVLAVSANILYYNKTLHLCFFCCFLFLFSLQRWSGKGRVAVPTDRRCSPGQPSSQPLSSVARGEILGGDCTGIGTSQPQELVQRWVQHAMRSKTTEWCAS